MSEKQTEHSSYKQIIKATSILGGVQVINILVQLIRSKAIAVLLGPVGIGLTGLLTANLNLITSFTNFGLGTLAIKDISTAYASKDLDKIKSTISLFRKLFWFTGGLGVVVTILMSGWLSDFSFGNSDYVLAFVLLSITLLFTQLNNGYLSVFQALRNLKILAKVNVLGSVISLLLTLPLYFFFGINGIVPALIITGGVTLLVSIYFSKSVVEIETIKIPINSLWRESRPLLKIGLLISSGAIFGHIMSYIFRLFIREYGGLEDVGFYSAGFSMTNTYFGMIFGAMATDYYPRLSAISSENEKCSQAVNEQAETAVLIFAPILVIFIVFINPIIELLYSSQFSSMIPMMYGLTLGTFLRIAGSTLGFLILAKNDRKIFFWNELIIDFYLLLFNIIWYYYYGLAGIGIAFCITILCSKVQTLYICYWRYKFYFNSVYWEIFSIQLIIILVGIGATALLTPIYSYLIGSVLCFISVTYSLRHLNTRVGLTEMLKKKIQK